MNRFICIFAPTIAIAYWLLAAESTCSYAQESPPVGGCLDGDMSCLWSDLFAHGECQLSFKSMTLSNAEEPQWYVASRRGGGWVLVDEFFAFMEPLIVERELRGWTEHLQAWRGDSDFDEVNGCELNYFSSCYWDIDSEGQNFEVCRQYAAARYRDDLRRLNRDQDGPREVGTCMHPDREYLVYRTPQGSGECEWVPP